MDAVCKELAAVSRCQLCLIVGDLNIEPSKISCLLPGILAGSWFDLQEAWVCASGVALGVTCKHSFASTGGTRRDFFIGCPLVTAALGWCTVSEDRWVLSHHSVQASFCVETWTARACLPVRVVSPPLWLASWTSFLDLSRSSRSTEVGRIWEVSDKFLRAVPQVFLDGIGAAPGAGDVSTAWRVWSLLPKFPCFLPFSWLVVPPLKGCSGGRGVARFRSAVFGGPVVGVADPEDGQSVHLCRLGGSHKDAD